MAGKIWTEEERRVMLNMYPHSRAIDVAERLGRSVKSIYARAKLMGIGKSEEFKHSEYSGRTSRMRQLGKDRRFKKGQTPANKGKKWNEWMTQEGRLSSLRTAFPKGNLPHNTRQDGDVVIRTESSGRQYKYIRISKGTWIELHRAVWMVTVGEIPDGTILRCKTSDTLNCDPSNWYLADRAEHLAKNSGRKEMNDRYIALVLARRDRDLRDKLMKMPWILDLKRAELTLKNTINENAL